MLSSKQRVSDQKQEIFNLLEVINYYLSNNFKEKWRHKFSERFVCCFQTRLLKSLKDGRPLKMDTLFSFLTKKSGYSKEQVLDFYNVTELELLRPFLTGTLTRHRS